jgi:hypothetical protein
MAVVVHKEVKVSGDWHHWSERTLKKVDSERFESILERYCIGTPLLRGERVGIGLTALAYDYSKSTIGSVYLLRSDDIARLRKIWSEYFGDFDADVGYFLWDAGDIIAYPEEMEQNKRERGFTDYRIILWVN